MLIARDGGCTKPCCTVGAYGCQVHHVAADWADGGNTNIDELGLACGPDNRIVGKDGGWTTRMNERCEVEWIPPPQLDTGQARLNYYHRPERLLRPDEPEPQCPNNTAEAGPIVPSGGRERGNVEAMDAEPLDGEPLDPEPIDAEPLDAERFDLERFDLEPIDLLPVDNAGEPGGPAPPDDQAA